LELIVNQDNSSVEQLSPRKYGAVAVIRRGEKWLVIRRSANVRAPRKLCFPGGTIELGEGENDAVVREMREELGISIAPISCIWRCVTPWNVALAFWTVELPLEVDLVPNALEVEEVMWLDTSAALAHEDLLESVKDFFEAYLRGEIRLTIG
jgi:8-oxo-dGTP diphosphatase